MLLLVILVVLFIGSGIPIYVALALPPLISIVHEGINPLVLVQRLFGGMDKFALMAVPFFIFAANLMGKGGMARRIIVLADTLVGRFYGGTASGTVLACLFFGALSGSSPATVVAVGGITYPMLLENNYGKKFSMGLISSASSLSQLIPPSITMIVYCLSTSSSVGKLFMAGIGPGILLGVALMAYSTWFAYKNNIRNTSKITGRQMWLAFKDASWALGVPVIILGGIYAGVFTPTESATVAAAYAIIVGLFIYKELSFKTLYETCVSSALVTAQVLILCAAAGVLSWMLTISQAQLLFQNILEPYLGSPFIIIILMNVILFIFGMFIDPTSFVLLLAPLFVPIAKIIGLDLIHLGVIMVMGGALGMYTPPFGLNLFVGMGIFNEDYAAVAKSNGVFIVIGVIVMLMISFWPGLSLWLPNKLY